jgi:protein-tyrosine-phosphatase/DNA-binding transcriptional ArsR family regulator
VNRQVPTLPRSDALTVRWLAALGQPLRWRAYRCVLDAGPAGITAGALAQLLGVAPSALSFHLKELSGAGLLHSEHLGRFVVYHPTLTSLSALAQTLAAHVQHHEEICMQQSGTTVPVHEPIRVLFLCSRNSARSIMAEALLNHLARSAEGSGQRMVRFLAHSAGRSPAEDHQPHPMALRALQDAGVAIEGQHSKNWDCFGLSNAPRMDLVITLCDQAVREPCPAWPGQPATAHWSFPDPTLPAPGQNEPEPQAFRQILFALQKRLELFMALPLNRLDKLMLETEAKRLAA